MSLTGTTFSPWSISCSSFAAAQIFAWLSARKWQKGRRENKCRLRLRDCLTRPGYKKSFRLLLSGNWSCCSSGTRKRNINSARQNWILPRLSYSQAKFANVLVHSKYHSPNIGTNVFPVPIYKNALRRSYSLLFFVVRTDVTERGNGERERPCLPFPFLAPFFSAHLPRFAISHWGEKAVNYGRGDAWGEERGGWVGTHTVSGSAECRRRKVREENSTNTTISHPKKVLPRNIKLLQSHLKLFLPFFANPCWISPSKGILFLLLVAPPPEEK